MDEIEIEIEIVEGRAARALGVEPARSAGLGRLRHGAFADAAVLEVASVEERSLARVRAAAIIRSTIVLAVESALAIRGLPFGAEPAFVFGTGDPAAPG